MGISPDLENELLAFQKWEFITVTWPDTHDTPVSITVGTVDSVCFVHTLCHLLWGLMGPFNYLFCFELFIWHNIVRSILYRKDI